MSTENVSDEIRNQLSVIPSKKDPLHFDFDQDDATYYRSLLFTSSVGLNPLLTAAQPIITLLSRIIASTSAGEIHIIQENFIHELMTFTKRALCDQVAREGVSIARFILCLGVDSALRKADWHSYWSGQMPLEEFYPGTDPDLQFVTLLGNLSRHSDKHIELLELIYVVISISFDRDYAFDETSTTQTICEHLFFIIRDYRGDGRNRLLIAPRNIQRAAQKKPLSLLAVAGSALFLIAIFYAGFNYMLNVSAHALPKHETSTTNYLSNEDL